VTQELLLQSKLEYQALIVNGLAYSLVDLSYLSSDNGFIKASWRCLFVRCDTLTCSSHKIDRTTSIYVLVLVAYNMLTLKGLTVHSCRDSHYTEHLFYADVIADRPQVVYTRAYLAFKVHTVQIATETGCTLWTTSIALYCHRWQSIPF